MNIQPWLNDKFMRPSMPRICLRRPRLNNIFEQLSDKRTIFVSAPAGYGKTLSTQMWLDISKRETIWIGLDSYDNTPAIFYKMFCMGILSLQPENNAMSEIMRSSSFTLSPVEHTILMLAEFAPDSRRFALVMDDMHLITNKEISKSGFFVRKRLPLSFVTIILTRNTIKEESAQSLGEIPYAGITADDLAFNEDETQQFFKLHERSITREEAGKVCFATGGWAIGVNALAMSGQTEPGSQSVQILGEYINRKLWEQWDEALHAFLLQTSVLDEMPVPLCQRLTGRADSFDILEQLSQANAFVTRLSADTFSYHHLFLDFLRTQAAENGLSLSKLNKTAAEYYLEQGDYFTARRFALRSKDQAVMLNVMNQLSQYRCASVDEFVQFSKMNDDESPSESTCEIAPFLYVSMMWEQYLRGNVSRMEYYMDRIYEHLTVIATDYPQYLENTLMMITLDHRVPLSDLTTHFQHVLTVAPPHTYPQGSTLTCEMPFLHRSSRDYSELADSELRERMRHALGPLFKENCDLIMNAIESGLHMEAGRRAEALASAMRAKELVNENTSDELRFSVYAHIVAVYYSLKRSDYDDMLIEAERYIEKNDSYPLRPNFAAFKTRFKLLNGDRTAAREWLGHYYVVDTETTDLYKIYQYFTTIRAYIVLGQIDRALHDLTGIKRLAVDFRRTLDLAEAGVLQAILGWIKGDKPEAQITLENVLRDIQPFDFIRVVSLEGAAILPILRKLETKIKRSDYEGPIQAHFFNRVLISAFEQSKIFKGITAHIRTKTIKLSKQQQRVLQLRAEGYTYNQIAEEMDLTIHTVKSHLSAAYEKLDAHTAMEAVTKAKERKLID